jgi:cytochrome oxidase assembly protein ShyY1
VSSPLLKPRWLTGHVLVIGLTVAFIFLGFWQLGRHYRQQEDNVVVEARLAAGAVELGQVAALGDELEFRRVVVSGRYDFAGVLELRPRARNGRVGYDQIVPLDTGEAVVLVNRGFVADSAGSGPDPSRGTDVVVTGTARLSQGTSRLGPQNPETGVLATIARIDLERLAPQFEARLYPVYLDLISEAPEMGGPATVLPPLPEPTSRPNLPYAIQWWLFATVVSVGWVLYLRKQFFVP